MTTGKWRSECDLSLYTGLLDVCVKYELDLVARLILSQSAHHIDKYFLLDALLYCAKFDDTHTAQTLIARGDGGYVEEDEYGRSEVQGIRPILDRIESHIAGKFGGPWTLALCQAEARASQVRPDGWGSQESSWQIMAKLFARYLNTGPPQGSDEYADAQVEAQQESQNSPAETRWFPEYERD